jgi:hypothetical protein
MRVPPPNTFVPTAEGPLGVIGASAFESQNLDSRPPWEWHTDRPRSAEGSTSDFGPPFALPVQLYRAHGGASQRE